MDNTDKQPHPPSSPPHHRHPPRPPSPNQAKTTIYTDGSRLQDEDGSWATGFSAFVESGPYNSPITRTPTMQHTPAYTCDTLPSEAEPTPGTCFGQSSYCHDSYSAEIVAIIVGLLIAPPEGNTNIKCDNQGVTQVAPNFANRTRRAQLKTPFHDLYRVVTFLLSARTTEIDWVRAHVGIPSNEVADTLAKTAAQCIKHHTTDINPDALPLDALMALCCLPINISIYPRKITRVDGVHLTTDAINYRDSGTPRTRRLRKTTESALPHKCQQSLRKNHSQRQHSPFLRPHHVRPRTLEKGTHRQNPGPPKPPS